MPNVHESSWPFGQSDIRSSLAPSGSETVRLLLVDPHEAVHASFRNILRGSASAELRPMVQASLHAKSSPSGFELEHAYGGEEAYELVRLARNLQHPYAVAFVDIALGGGWDGVETASRILEANPETAVALCAERKEHAWGAILDAFGGSDRVLLIGKPYDQDEVRQLLRALRSRWGLAGWFAQRLRGMESAIQEKSTELRQVEQRLEVADEHRKSADLAASSAQKLRAVAQLAVGVAHEINTPLQYIGDSLQFLDEVLQELLPIARRSITSGGDDGSAPGEQGLTALRPDALEELSYIEDQVPRALSRALMGIEQITDIVRALKEFSYPDERGVEALDLNQAVEDALIATHADYRYVAHVQTDFADLPMILCRPTMIRRLIVSLLASAARAVRESVQGGSERGTISVLTAHEGDMVRVSIHDTGTRTAHAKGATRPSRDATTGATGFEPSTTLSAVVAKQGGSLSFERTSGGTRTVHLRLPTMCTEYQSEEIEL